MFKRLCEGFQAGIVRQVLEAQESLFEQMKSTIIREMYIGFFLERTNFETQKQEFHNTIENLESLVRSKEAEIHALHEQLTSALLGEGATLAPDDRSNA